VEGHGIPLMDVERVGPSIAYWAAKHCIMETDWNVLSNIIMEGKLLLVNSVS
jgi:hypothetical protein